MRAENSESSSFVHSLTILPNHYLAFAYSNTSLHNVECFCVNGNSVFRIDTTFEIIDGLWVTDTSYTNESIIKADDQENPEFPGPMMVHFRKDEATYRRFAGELVTENPALLNVRKIGTDMDNK